MTGYRFEFLPRRRGDGAWLRVDGGPLPLPIEIRVQHGADGRSLVTGLRIDSSATGGEITAQALRTVRFPEILAALFDLAERPALSGRLIREAVIRGVALAHMDRAPTVSDPQDESYRAFAQTYLAGLVRQPHRAMSAAAEAHNISRTTANRWAAACRHLGYLPPKEGEQ